MAAMVSAWSTKPGAWALDSEQNESDLLQQQQEAASSADFPTLAAAAATKPKKNKTQPLSLSQFNSGSFSSKSPDDLLLLPTGPRQRSPDELDRSRLGGGFRSYGSYGDDSSRRQGGFSLGRDRDSSSRDPLPPSRADETADWAANKRFSSVGSFERRDRDRERGGFFASSKADEVDNWASGKSSAEAKRLSGDGARSGRGWSRSGFEGLSIGNGADGDRWGRKREDDGDVNLGNSSSGRPRLVLQPRSVPLSEGNVINKGIGNGSSPFGDARPREEVLKEKGKDWKEIDEKLEAVKIKDAPEEKWEKRGSNGGRVQLDDEYKAERSWRKASDDVETEPKVAAAGVDRFVLYKVSVY